jgi:RHS repeat-associated protein
MSRSNLDTPKQQRTVLLATDQQNSVLSEIVSGRNNPMAYSAYGHQSAEHEVVSGLGFNGELREASRWYFLGNGYRVYNPRLMRFHSPDSWSPFGAGGLNAYTYVGGDPVNDSDPTGHAGWRSFLSGTFDFFFGGPDITGPSRSQILSSWKPMKESKLSPFSMRPEKTGELGALKTLGSVTASAPGPRGNYSPAIHNVDTPAKSHPGYVEGAAAAGLTNHAFSAPRSNALNPNLLAGRINRAVPQSDTWTSSIHGPKNTHNRLRGGGDATGTHPRGRIAAGQAQDRQFVEVRIQHRREAIRAALQARNAQLRQAGHSRAAVQAIMISEARSISLRIRRMIP